MQKLLRLRSLIQNPPLSSGDPFVSPTKEPHTVVQSPVVDSTSQDIHVFPSSSSPATSEGPLRQATIPISKAFLRTLSRYSSSQSNKMLRSSSKGEYQVEEDNILTRNRERKASVASSKESANYIGPKTIWTNHDSHLPCANPPPPPPKRVKHARNRSEINATLDPTISSRPSTSHRGSSGRSSTSDFTSLSPKRSVDAPALKPSNEDGNQSTADVRHPLTRASTLTTLEASDETETTISPFNRNWQPPTSWAGPSKTVSPDGDHKPKLVEWFTRKKGSKSSSKGGSTQMPTRLNRARSLIKLKPIHLTKTEELEEVSRGRSLSSGAMVKIQCYEGDGCEWHETPMADIIPKLRNLKFK